MFVAFFQLAVGTVLGETSAEFPMLGDFINGALKGFFVLAGILYLLFAFIATRQIATMKKTLDTPFSPVLNLMAWGHLALAGLVLFYFINL